MSKGVTILLLGATLLAGAVWAAMGDWSSFRGNAALTGTVSTAFTDRPRLLWTYETKEPIVATAAIVGDTAYVATRGKKLSALRLADGRPKWTFASSDFISASPCVTGGSVYVGDESGIFYAVNAATGKLRWKLTTSDKIMSSATPVPGGVLFGSYDNYLYKLSTVGKLIWKFRSEAQVHGTPCVGGGTVIIAGCDGYVRMIDLKSGKQRAAAKLESNFGASPVYANGVAFVGSMGGDCAAVSVKDGKLLWHTYVSKDQGGFYGSPALTSDSLIFPSRAKSVVRLARGTGKLVWTFPLRGECDSSPVVAGGRAYFGADDGNVYELDVATGRKVWQYRAGSLITAGPALGRDRMVISTSDGAVLCFGR